VPSVPLSAQEIRTTLSAYRTWTSACDRNAQPLIKHMSTLNVVRDLDRLRRAVGDKQLTYAGYSYGTLIGATYANLYPGKVRALLLDGMVDPAERTQRSLLNELNRAGGFETALRGFLDLCARSGAACTFSAGGNPKAKFDRLRERLRQSPLTLPNGSQYTISNLTDFVGGELYDAAEFPTLAGVLQALHQIAFGAPAAARSAATSQLDTARDSSRWRALADAYSYNSADSLYAVNCVDKRLPRLQAAWPAIAKGFELVHRTFGRTQAYGAAVCATWPVVTNERYAGPWDRKSANTVLVVGTYFDPATPYVFAQRATAELGNARLLSLNGYGHTSILSSTCVDEKTNNYILTSQVPPAGTLCQADASPFATATAAAKAGVPELAGRS
jgi:pimeloyl-ACP methyl ester carboxylesterase